MWWTERASPLLAARESSHRSLLVSTTVESFVVKHRRGGKPGFDPAVKIGRFLNLCIECAEKQASFPVHASERSEITVISGGEFRPVRRGSVPGDASRRSAFSFQRGS